MASLLDLLAPWLRTQAQQMQDQVVTAQPPAGANMSIDPSMLRGMPQQNPYAQQLQDPSQWNLSGQPQVPDYSRITTPGNPGGPSYDPNYGQTQFPGSATFGNPQGPLVPPGNRGLHMASYTQSIPGDGQAQISTSGSSATQLSDMIKILKQLQEQQQAGR